jgi:hypothetical protein
MTIEVKKGDYIPYRAINEALDRAAAEIEHQSKFSITFEFDGHQWEVEIWARDWDEAERKCNALRETARVTGEIVESIPYRSFE